MKGREAAIIQANRLTGVSFCYTGVFSSPHGPSPELIHLCFVLIHRCSFSGESKSATPVYQIGTPL